MADEFEQYTRTYNALVKQEAERVLDRMRNAQRRLAEGRGDDDDQACVDFYGTMYDAIQRQRLT